MINTAVDDPNAQRQIRQVSGQRQQFPRCKPRQISGCVAGVRHASRIQMIQIDIGAVPTNHLIDTAPRRRQVETRRGSNLCQEKAQSLQFTNSIEEISLFLQLNKDVSLGHHEPVISLYTQRVLADPRLDIIE